LADVRARESRFQLKLPIRRDAFAPLGDETSSPIATGENGKVEFPVDDARRLERRLVPCLRMRGARDARREPNGEQTLNQTCTIHFSISPDFYEVSRHTVCRDHALSSPQASSA